MRHYMMPTELCVENLNFFFFKNLVKKCLFYYPVIMIPEILKEKCMFDNIQKRIQTYETVTKVTT